jgi:hypothetical protein
MPRCDVCKEQNHHTSGVVTVNQLHFQKSSLISHISNPPFSIHHLNLTPRLTQALPPDTPSRLTTHPHDWEENAGMANRLRGCAQYDHPALQRNEFGLNAHE